MRIQLSLKNTYTLYIARNSDGISFHNLALQTEKDLSP